MLNDYCIFRFFITILYCLLLSYCRDSKVLYCLTVETVILETAVPCLLTIFRITKHFGDEWKNFQNLTLCALALLPTAFQPTAMFIKCQCKGNSLLKNNCTNNANCVDQQFWKILNNKTKVPKRANGLLQSIVLSDLNVWMPDGWKCFALFCTPAHNITYITLSVKDNRYYLIMEMDIGICFKIPAK